MNINFINFDAFQKEAIDNFTFLDGPKNPSSFADLKSKLAEANGKLPTAYQTAIYEPFVVFVNTLNEAKFQQIENDDQESAFFFDFVQAILQHAEAFQPVATSAFEEVVSDLYDGFLSAEDRRNIKIPNQNQLAPIVKWGNPKDGPYTLPSDATAQLKVACAIVNLPPSISKGVIAGWASLAHETAGHDISHSDEGLLPEMQQAVKKAILANKKITNATIRTELSNYWSSRIDETSADIMGILNMGPAAAIGTIPLFRAFLKRFGAPPKLRSQGPKDDVHPADILRVMLGASVVKLLSFSDAAGWANAILAEGLKDMTTIELDVTETSSGIKIDPKSAQLSADTVAKVLVQKPFTSLQHHALQEIQDWADDDELIVKKLRQILNGSTKATPQILQGAYAAHVVAAAIYESLLVNQNIAPLFSNMLTILKQMHDDNPTWGPLPIIHRGDMKKDLMFQIYENNSWTNNGITYPQRNPEKMMSTTKHSRRK